MNISPINLKKAKAKIFLILITKEYDEEKYISAFCLQIIMIHHDNTNSSPTTSDNQTYVAKFKAIQERKKDATIISRKQNP